MDFNNLKDEFANTFKNLSNTVIDSPFFHLIKEKYDNLSSFYRKTIYVSGFLILACILLYYPSAHLYSSWKNMWSFNTKKKLTHDLIDLSISTQTSTSRAYTPDRDPVQFINQKIITLRIPKNQIKEVKKPKIAPPQESTTTFSMPTTIQTVEVAMENLNLKEVIEYGHQLEQLSKNIKLTNLHMIENLKQDNYFNVSYILSFFNIKQKKVFSENKKLKEKSPPSTNTENNKLFDNLKTKSTPLPPPSPPQNKKTLDRMDTGSTPIMDLKKADSDNPIPNINRETQDVPLLKLKKEDIPNDSAHFENRPKKVKERDLLPKPSIPKKMEDKLFPSDLPPPPPLPSSNEIEIPKKDDTKEEEK